MSISWAFLDRPPLSRQLELVVELERLGYKSVFTVETRLVRDGVTPLGAFATRTARIGLGLLSNSWTRGPELMAMGLATLEGLAPGRVVVALSEYWDPLAANQGIERVSPDVQITEYVAALRAMLGGRDGTEAGRIVPAIAHRLAEPPGRPPPIYLLGTGEMMAEAAGRSADGILVNGLVSPDGAAALLEVAHRSRAQRSEDWTSFSRLQLVNVAMDEDRQKARGAARRLIARYVAHQPHIAAASGLPTETIAELRRIIGPWPGSPERVDGALHLVDDASIDRLVVAGTPHECRVMIRAWRDAGVDEIVVVPLNEDVETTALELAPRGGSG